MFLYDASLVQATLDSFHIYALYRIKSKLYRICPLKEPCESFSSSLSLSLSNPPCNYFIHLSILNQACKSFTSYTSLSRINLVTLSVYHSHYLESTSYILRIPTRLDLLLFLYLRIFSKPPKKVNKALHDSPRYNRSLLCIINFPLLLTAWVPILPASTQTHPSQIVFVFFDIYFFFFFFFFSPSSSSSFFFSSSSSSSFFFFFFFFFQT
ncbi:unnamed protein product [Acanthosepion pharaonis]|uniref:Uncharacterized protein n=1 Tax=Acanthosepion pharaonis TaxID=158019 RepID=A0A812CU01_ACAPH|nr:unnamed protein product [Sepia pharaonis]